MKKLPDAELELMMAVWDAGEPITRMEIEDRMTGGRSVAASTTLALLSRLEERGYLKREKRGKINYYSAALEKEPYLKEAGRSMLQKMFHGSLSDFAAALYDGEKLDKKDIEELQAFIDRQSEEA